MASILDFLDSDTGRQFTQKSSEEIGEYPEKVFLEDERHNGSVLDNLKERNLSNLLGEGSGVLKHVFGGNLDKTAGAVSGAIGMDNSKVSKLLKMAAPVVMGILGKQKSRDKVGTNGVVGISRFCKGVELLPSPIFAGNIYR